MLGAGGPGPAMSAHLATPPYVPYPGAARYGDYYWLSAGSMDGVPAEEAPGLDALPLPAAKTPSPSGTCPAEPSVPGAGSSRVPGAGMLRAAPARLCCRWGGTAGAAARGAGVATAQRDGPEGRTEASPPFRRHEAACAHLPTAAKPLRVPRAPEF